MVEALVKKIDSIVRPVRGTKWQQSQPRGRQVRKELHLVLKESELRPAGELFDKAYGYIKETIRSKVEITFLIMRLISIMGSLVGEKEKSSETTTISKENFEPLSQ